jgi:hypothetical protein
MIKYTLIVAACICSTVALAQQPTVPQLQEYTIKVSPADVDIIAEGLQTQPFGKVFPLMNKLRTQIVEQQQAAAPKPVPDLNGGTASGSSSNPQIEKK